MKFLKERNKLVYHGSNYNFDEFIIGDNRNGDLYGKGIYFTNNKDYAKMFGKYLYECRIVMKNPFDLTSNDMSHFNNLRDIINDENELLYFDDSIKNKNYTTALRRLRHKDILNNDDLKKMGYDSIIGYCEFGGKEFVVFDAEQVIEIKKPSIS